ncbi:MAG: ABC transporter permease [Dermatophilaceae bacterium]
MTSGELDVETMRAARPSLAVAGWHRFTIELLQFRRSREAVFFTIAFPLVMLALFGTIFGGGNLGPKSAGVTFAQYFIASMMAAGVWGSCFTNLAISVPSERDSGALKRLAGTPMPMTAYFAGKIALVLLLSAVETVLLLAMGLAFYDLRLPSPEKWLTFGWVMTLGITSCTLLGLAVSGLVRNARTASAIVTPLAILLQFISGVYFVFAQLPGWLQAIASLFPLRWLALGLRSVFLPEAFAATEPGGTWQTPTTAIVMIVWCVLGLAITKRTFTWMSERER